MARYSDRTKALWPPLTIRTFVRVGGAELVKHSAPPLLHSRHSNIRDHIRSVVVACPGCPHPVLILPARQIRFELQAKSIDAVFAAQDQIGHARETRPAALGLVDGEGQEVESIGMLVPVFCVECGVPGVCLVSLHRQAGAEDCHGRIDVARMPPHRS